MNDGTISKHTFTATTNDAPIEGTGKLAAVKESLLGLKDKVAGAGGKLVDVKAEAVRRGEATLATTRKLATAHPLKALAIAFGAGYVAMRITRMFR